MSKTELELEQFQSSLFNRVSPEPMSGCWLWPGAGNGHGYGVMRCGPKQVYAHRVFYTVFRGTIPPGYHIDHLCRTKRCVNPKHLEPVTPWENVTRGMRGRLRTTCVHGHPIAGNTAITQATDTHHEQKYCRACKREASAQQRRQLGGQL